MDMRTYRHISYIRTLLLTLAFLANATGTAWAQAPSLTANDILIQIMPSGTEGNGSTEVTATEGSVSVLVSERNVTLTVTPASGYKIKKDLIVVEKMINPTNRANAPRRTPGIGTFELIGTTEYVTDATTYTFTVPTDYDGAYVMATFVPTSSTQITSLSDITNPAGTYVLARDIDASGFSTISDTFTGTIDGGFHKIFNLGEPLFTTLAGTVKNVTLEDVSISGYSGNTGAIACTANNSARIYNVGILSGSVGGTGYTGGLVGLLDGTARVINCYSYANITSGSVKAGIVGYNNYASKYNDLKTMVMNCMFYGDITTGGTISPIYGGEEISNDYKKSTNNRLNNYNYYLYEAPFSKNNTTNNVIISKYNCALAAEERFLVRFEFYRNLLNSTRELAAWYATGDPTNGRGIGDANKMAKWVLDKSIAPYPILKVQGKYPSVVNYDPDYTNDETGAKVRRNSVTERNRGKDLGTTLAITIRNSTSGGQAAPTDANVTTTSLTRPRIDKDTLNYNFNYDKVQLPYYNEVGTGNYTGNKVVTGWKIVSMTGGTSGGYTETNYDAPHYNYADRDHYGKDLYSVSKRVYPQGGYFNVPTGVTGITIEPYWGKAAYLSDACYDRYGYKTDDNLTQIGGGQRYTNSTNCPVLEGEQKVYTTVSSALATLTGISNATVYDYALVLVGNYHHHTTEGKSGPELSNGTKPFTIMSVDLNKDNEPDYCLIYRSGKNQKISPIRFDFITVPGMVMAHKNATNGDLGIPGNCTPMGWFEITTTGLIKYGQFEHSYSGKTLAPVIFMGGVIDQFVANNTGADESFNNKTKYMLFGDNVWFKMLSNGNHMDKSQPMPHRPISITGGEYESLYLSGYFRPNATACTSGSGDRNAECYIDGGKFGEVAGAGQENIDGDITWLIDHADMESFYGGGLKVVKNGSQVTGNISTTIKNSHVDLFCGGPKFGDMAATKTVTTNATDCVFGTYFGAGYGGTSIYRWCPEDKRYNKFEEKNYNFNGWVGESYDASSATTYRGKYSSGMGVACGYEYELFGGSAGNVGRLYLKYASFSLAQTNDVTSTLTGCTVTGNFYGGGSLGKVTGNATSTLDNCTVNGSVFGAGYSATTPNASIMNTGGFTVNGAATNPYYNETTGVYEKADPPATTDYKWVHIDGTLSNGTQTLTDDGLTINTTEDLTGLGTVAGDVTLNITGNTLVEGKIFDGNGVVTAQTGGVFGGGAKSEVTGTNKTVTVNINQSAGSASRYINNVYGGGDEGDVASEVVVNVQNTSYVLHDVFGGGNAADVKKNTQVTMSGGTVMGNIYGGGNLGDVGRIDDKSNKRQYTWTGTDGNANSSEPYAITNSGVTHVNITGGTPNGNVFGGGKGLANTFWCEKGMVYSTNVSIKDVTVDGSIYGGGEIGRVETNTTVTIGPDVDDDKTIVTGNVFGAGKGLETHGYSALVRGNTSVTIQHGAQITGNVYGGGEIASVGKYNVDSNGMPYSLANTGSGSCHINIPGKTRITGDIFGGGKGVVPSDYQLNNETYTGDDRPKRMTFDGEGNNIWQYYDKKSDYFIYLQTLALTTQTEVEINPGTSDTPIQSTKGNVYGGSENGIVQHGTSVTISGDCKIGDDAIATSGNIYGGGKGLENVEGAGLVGESATVTINNGTILGSVYGGGVLGATKGNVTVNINGGEVKNDVYGGGAYAHTNTSNWHLYSAVTGLTPGSSSVSGLFEKSFGGAYTLTTDATAITDKTYYRKNNAPTWTDGELKSSLNKTRVNLHGGTIRGDAYGGALGDETHSPKVYGDILVDLNGTTSADGLTGTVINTSTTKGCVVNQVFGCNNAYGSPQGNVLVHVYATQNAAAEHIANQEGDTGETIPKKKGRYDVQAVYGGGNQAAYEPAKPDDPTTSKTQVVIEGCDYTSIKDVYGGGNAAAVPSTEVTVNSCYEINTLFGGGNGSGDGNPGADVGTHKVNVENTLTSENYGTGIAKTKLYGGEIHTVYGGSNEKGNIVNGTSIEVNNETGACTLNVGEIYGAGNNAKMDGGTDIVMGCMPEGVSEEIYAGARNADVAGDVKLTLTSGKFGRVFGGNRHGGKLMGSITVNIEETGSCAQPLIIGELYGGGNLADYSIYGYKNTGTVDAPVWEARVSADDTGTGPAEPYADPKLNIRAFTSIGAVYGGGYRAKMVANPSVDINVAKGSHAANAYDAGSIANIHLEKKVGNEIESDGTTTLYYPAHEADKIGTIGNVFGGGNLAEIIGNVSVHIGDETKSYFKTEPTHLGTEGTDYNHITSGTYAGLYEVDVDGAIIKGVDGTNLTGTVYGGGNEADIHGDAKVNICAVENEDTYTSVTYGEGKAGVTIYGAVFGAGKGLDTDVDNTTVAIAGGTVKKSIYGGGELGTVDKDTKIFVLGGEIGDASIEKGGATIGNVYGGGQGNLTHPKAGLIKGTTTINISGGNIYHNIYGGGAYGSVGTYIYYGETEAYRTAYAAADEAGKAELEAHKDNITGYTSGGKAKITITGGTIGINGKENGMVFGSSRGDVHSPGSDGIDPNDRMAWVYDTEVIIGTSGQGTTLSTPTIKGSIYGSGENGHTYHDTEVKVYSGTIGSHDGTSFDATRGNIYGGGCGTDMYDSNGDSTEDAYNPLAGIVRGTSTVLINGGQVMHNVYGAGAMGSVTGNTLVTISGGTIGYDGIDNGNVYGAARGAEGITKDYAHVGGSSVTISGGTVKNNVFGGGERGSVKGSVAVNVTGGQVINDVYGGGALADTNTDNWVNDALTADGYHEVSGLTTGSSFVQGLYTAQNSEALITDKNAKAEGETTYYRYGTSYNTTLNLTGGIIGNAYGGGLGQKIGIDDATSDIAANVYGDVSVMVNGTAFTDEDKTYSEYWYIPTSGTEYVKKTLEKPLSVPFTGRVFGCNNINGTPKGNVKVTVRRTKRINDAGVVVDDHVVNKYEIRGVYGGGNLSDYTPATNKNTSVDIHNCEHTKIEKVYGGGNSANVPTTDVKIYGCLDIHYVFGGGNGADVIHRNNRWEENDGANVTGDAHVVLYGGTISDAFIGSDTKGSVNNATSEVTSSSGGDCDLKVTNYYGSSKRSDVYGDVNITISACSNSQVENVYGGSYDAQIHGNITMTITSGILKNVYGGNDRLGSIGGNITINIEEADACQPIIIQNLYGGGYNAPYPGEGAKKITNEKDESGHYTGAGVSYNSETGTYTGLTYADVTSGDITINVKSCTRIDNIYGGGLGSNAIVTGNTRVNVNMAKGAWAGQVRPDLSDYTGETIPNVQSGEGYREKNFTVGESVTDYYKLTYSSEDKTYNFTKITGSETAVAGMHYYEKVSSDYVINNDIGTIGNIYGGGDAGNVYGNASVYIASQNTIDQLVYNPALEGSNKYENKTFNVLGAHITGDVFGGGNQADVTGNSEVYICTADGTTSVAEGTSGVTIQGTDFQGVFGGGNKGNVEGNSYVYLGGGAVNQSIYGGGCEANVLGNTSVTMLKGYVYDGVYGGGLQGSVGTVTARESKNHDGTNHNTSHSGCVGGRPKTYADNTGKCTVIINGGQVGPIEVATKGMKNEGGDGPVDVGFVFGAGRGDVVNPDDDPDADFYTYVKETEVTISGTALIMASVYGGGENGRVLGDTHVKIQGGQIGCGEAPGNVPKIYTEDEWTSENAATFKECLSWDYKAPFLPHDPYAEASDEEDAKIGTDGHTYYGSVFGGGSGYFPYQKADGTHEWLRSAGVVYGNTVIDITGGHILTCVYGGNETTDVGTYTNNDKGQPLVKVSGGKCTINMVGGTIGVPRTDEDAQAHPVTCYLFGAGKGDQRTRFNTWTNVQETVVNVSGTARIFGSVFGGGEDGHVLGDAKVNIGGEVKIDLNGDGDTDDEGETFTAHETLKIGTTGTSYVDGNVFGGGRGFSGLALTAGSTGGNAEVNISAGTMLGSVYGGGRLASVGIPFTSPTDNSYGQLLDDVPNEDPTKAKTYGHITINISGGTIGTTTTSDDDIHPVGGNVFGGSMGRITLLDGSLNDLWPRQAVVKLTNVTISGGTILNNVYGGSEYGIVRNLATVNMTGGTIHGNVFGGGYGSDRQDKTTITPAGYPNTHYTFTPMLWTGCVSGSTFVNISGGTVGKNVYGGGDMASVGLIDFASDVDGNFTAMTKHESLTNGFGLSWPYQFNYHAAAPDDPADIGGGKINGKSTVNITGTANILGIVFGAGKGKVWFGANKSTPMDITTQRYTEAFMSNVLESEVTIGTNGGSDNPHVRTVYGGGEDGHVYENAKVTINSGTIDNSVFGGGKGTSTFTTTLLDPLSPGNPKGSPESVHSWTAGKVYGNTEVIMNGGSVGRFIYGGGNMASVGKGNYAGGNDDYYPAGYGETLTGSLWTNMDFMNSGKSTVTILGGRVGPELTLPVDQDKVDTYTDNGIPYGSVFGASRGLAAKSVQQSPRYMYMPDFFLGYVNKAFINIGGTTEGGPTQGTGPTITGSVYGGGQDGHVRNSTEVRIFKGSIAGQGYYETARRSGNVFGAGSGIGTYTDGGSTTYCNNSSGSVTCTTLVEVNGGSIAGSVYGGGALASVGPYKPEGSPNEIHAPSGNHKSCSYTRVDIKGGAISGSVFGASRGPSNSFYETQFSDQGITYNPDMFATDIWSDVNISGGTIDGNVYGGGEGGRLTESATVTLTGGVIGTASDNGDVYGGGKGTKYIASDVGGDTSVELNPDKTGENTGCVVRRIFGCNDLNGTPKGHVSVHVYATQHRNTTDFPHIGNKYEKYGDVTKYIDDHSELNTLAEAVGMTNEQITAYENAIPANGTDAEKTAAIENWREAISEKKYDVMAVYGGGNLAPYEPTNINSEVASVVIDGCQLTSIKQVYGGGNAAFVPGTSVRVNEAYEIDEVFGGGNGKDSYLDPKDNKWYQNPGANVGYEDFTEMVGGESGEDEAHAISQTDKADAVGTDPAIREKYKLGSGVATTSVLGGRIHYVYGGSNKRGNISNMVMSVYQESGTCALNVDKSFGAGKDAPTDATPVMKMDCVGNMEKIFGGSTNADVYNDIVLTITNGNYGQVFGGNDTDGAVYGSITVNIEEGGCLPIRIGELYAGGYLAPYSKYGYEKNDDGTYKRDNVTNKLIPLTSGENPKNDPCINVISATSIGDIYGGGYQAAVVGTPHINVNMKAGRVEVVNTAVTGDPVWKDNEGKGDTYSSDIVTDEISYYVSDNGLRVDVERREKTSSDVLPDDSGDYVETVSGTDYVYQDDTGTFYKVNAVLSKTKHWAALNLGTIDNIYGGGNQAEVIGDTHVEIGTGTHYNMDTHVLETISPARNAATITGSVFGGGLGATADVTGNTNVTFANGSIAKSIYGGGSLGDVGTYEIETNPDTGSKTYNFTDNTGVCNVTITGGTVGPTGDTNATTENPGNVFGAGMGSDANYECDKAMASSTSVNISNGTIKGTVYGGGQIARIENNTNVTIGLEDDDNSAPVIKGYVYGAGQGVTTHGYSGLVRGNSTVIVQGNAKVESSIYGGGEMATVGKYVVVAGIPTTPTTGGVCTVTVRDNAVIGRDDMKMTTEGGPDDWGHVFGAGRGVLPYEGLKGAAPQRKMNDESMETFDAATYGTEAAAETKYLGFLETLALAGETHVTITDNAFVKGDVFGGSENGRVQTDTYVTIDGSCQIGAGYDTSTGKSLDKYADEDFIDPSTTTVTDGNALKATASWPYAAPYAMYDRFAQTTSGNEEKYEGGATTHGGRVSASDGHSFYGNVFGGGSGYYPYKPGKWHANAGYVGGNTNVTISGGHILTNVYGGNEMSNVEGNCYITMTNGTVGVPRTLAQIAANPTSGYIFGAGMGDPRPFFNSTQPANETPGSYGSVNVGNTEVEISGGIVYGSVLGGAEDGHVLGNTHVTIKDNAWIGTWGTSGVDGNIFGGGRGLSGTNLEAGNVIGNTTVDFLGGKMLGSIYGGGRMASVGTDFSKTETPDNGFFQNDVEPVYYTQEEIDAANEGDPAYGKTTVDVKTAGATTGHVTINVSGGTIGNDRELIAPISSNIGGLPADISTWTDANWETWQTDNNIPKTKFDKETRRAKFTMGGKVYGGSMGGLTYLNGDFNTNWPKVGQVKMTAINITGGTIKRDVLGGGELGTVKADTHVNISGGTIGFDVYGGGYGSEDNTAAHQTVLTVGEGGSAMHFAYTPMMFAGCVGGNTYVDISGGWVKKNVYGGGEIASVGVIDFSATESDGKYTYINNVEHRDIDHEGENNEVVRGFALSWPWKIAYSTLVDGGTSNVNITGGRIGVTGKDYLGSLTGLTEAQLEELSEDNGDVFAAGEGLAGDRYNMAFSANVKTSYLTIDYPSNHGATPDNYKNKTGDVYDHDCIVGAAHGGAENGHVIEDAHVTMNNGLIVHSLYGGGKGKGTYKKDVPILAGANKGKNKERDIYSLTAGKVFGNTYLTMNDGYVGRNVYGGGNIASVGKGNYAGGADDYSTDGYGETLTGTANENLWEHSGSFDPDADISASNTPSTMADYFLSSGKTFVKVLGGTVGYVNKTDPSKSIKSNLPYGNVFGGSAGEAAPEVTDLPRYLYCPAFFSGYVNETDVVIGRAATPASGTEGEEGYVPATDASGPVILGSVYGGGQDGHVRRDTKVTVNAGEIGLPFTDTTSDTWRTVFKHGENKTEKEELDDPQWLHRGNVYAGGSGISLYEFDFDGDGNTNGTNIQYGKDPVTNEDLYVKEKDYSTSSGSVTRFTNVDIKGGTIHRNVYGGGSLGSVGAPDMGQGYLPYKPGQANIGGSIPDNGPGRQSMCIVKIGGDGPVTIGTPDGYGGDSNFKFNSIYGGEVYGACRGLSSDNAQFATSIWTQVLVKDGATILGNVYGGGDAGMVKKDTDVQIGAQ